MAQTPAQRQAAYRQRRLQDGTDSRISVILAAPAKAALERLAAHHGITQREALEQALCLAEEQTLAGIAPAARSDYYDKRRAVVTA